ncbi:MAG: DNA repair protein RecO [Patescibacteria group bacterium]|jgi:DNA repair protein RecO (recombination protein O)|nr:DNA repair protein RecO [Patescibacteria group bacterium]
MEETVNTKSIVLERRDFRENDVLVSFYSPDRGRMNLIARGAKKKTSKLAGHIEPLNIVDIMIIKGKQYDYVGSVKNFENFPKIKNNYEKLILSQSVLYLYKKLLKDGEEDSLTYKLLYDFLYFLEENEISDYELYFAIFKIKFFYLLGYTLNLKNCSRCSSDILEEEYKMSVPSGGLLCDKCCKKENILTISNSCIKMLKLATKTKDTEIIKIKINKKDKKDFLSIISSFEKYYSY